MGWDDKYSYKEVSLLENTKWIGMHAFALCNYIDKIIIPPGLRFIDDEAFMGSSIPSITVPFDSGGQAFTIYERSFKDCTQLHTVDLPDNLTRIWNNCFEGCTALTSFTIRKTTPPTLDADVFLNANPNMVIYVPSESVSAYQSAPNWSEHASKIQAIP